MGKVATRAKAAVNFPTKAGPTYMRSMEMRRLYQLIQAPLSNHPGVASDADQRAYRHDEEKRQNSAHSVG